ncbi:nuclear transport factor 2 family protein [Echinicola salinicaeni]|uniref:nuclear transport factor 2 family protein n=1 Tax=Echinicola salinicaeni TaxID=2762757 RepID=UPI0016461F19|nr:nuclear transport factor 2 family protein [Echinicola salinicaeni]
MDKRTKIARQYIEFLEKGDSDKIISLFAENGTVESPLYGKMKAAEFYKTLFSDTILSVLELKGIFSEKASNNLALYFNYKWTLKNNELADFDVVDIIEFNRSDEIKFLKIIYDTVKSREIMNKIRD